MSRGCFLLAVMMGAVPVRLEATGDSGGHSGVRPLATGETPVLYPHNNGGCYWITDRAECCQHIDARNYSEAGHYYHEQCIPAAEGKQFTSGRVCEPACWVRGTCGDGIPQGDRIGLCQADDNILVVSDDTSTRAVTTRTVTTTTHTYTSLTVTETPMFTNKDKMIAGAVAGTVGGVALVGGLLGGLLTTVAPTTTLAPTTTAGLAHLRFLQDPAPAPAPAADSAHHAQHGGAALWWATLALGVPLGAVALLIVGFQVKSRSGTKRQFNRAVEMGDSTDDESMSPMTQSGPDAFDLIDKNHDGVISQEEYNAAYGVKRFVTVATALPVYVLPMRPTSVVATSSSSFA